MKLGAAVMVIPFLFGAEVASAQENDPSSEIQDWFSGNVAVTSDYVFRGISQSLEDPAIQGGIDFNHPSGLYLGAWGSSVRFGEDLPGDERAFTEVDLYGGIGWNLAGMADLDVGAVYYGYPGVDSHLSYDFWELGLGANRSVGPLGTGVALKYSPDFFAGSGPALYYGATVDMPVSFVTLTGSVGRQTIDDSNAFGTPNYTDWGVGAEVGWAGLSFSGAYVGTSLDDGECFGGTDLCDARVVFTVAR